MKHSYSSVGGIVSQAFNTARTQKHAERAMRLKQPKFSKPWVERPVRSIGRFYDKLDRAGRQSAKTVAKIACKAGAQSLQSVYYRLERIARHINYAPT